MKILALGDFTGYQYHPFGDIAARLKEILSNEQLSCTEDRKTLLPEALSSYDVLLTYVDSWKKCLTREQMKGIIHFLRAGKGLVGLHCGISYQNSEYQRLFGAKFIQHPPEQQLSIKIVNREHPVTADLTNFTITDELYWFRFFSGEELNILMECNFEGRAYPVAWCREYQSGRIIYLAPGHTAGVLENQVFSQALLNSIRWAGRQK